MPRLESVEMLPCSDNVFEHNKFVRAGAIIAVNDTFRDHSTLACDESVYIYTQEDGTPIVSDGGTIYRDLVSGAIILEGITGSTRPELLLSYYEREYPDTSLWDDTFATLRRETAQVIADAFGVHVLIFYPGKRRSAEIMPPYSVREAVEAGGK